MPEKLTLRQMRLMREVSQREMAYLLGVNVNTYVAWEKCPAKVKAGKLLQVLQVLGYKMDDLRLFNKADKPYQDDGDD